MTGATEVRSGARLPKGASPLKTAANLTDGREVRVR